MSEKEEVKLYKKYLKVIQSIFKKLSNLMITNGEIEFTTTKDITKLQSHLKNEKRQVLIIGL